MTTFICETCNGLGVLKATLYHSWANPPICPSCDGTGRKTSYDEAARLWSERLRKTEKGCGTIRRIADVPKHCSSREHSPPTHIVLEPGVYEHTCPSCGASVVFTVNRTTC